MNPLTSPRASSASPPFVPGNAHRLVSRDPARLARSDDRRTAFVLSGGASLGALQVGMLRALYERGIVPDLLVGASVGALNAAFVGSRPQTVETADELASVWRNLRREDVFPVGLRALVRGLTGNGDHLFGDFGLRALARRHLRIERIEDAVVPLHLITFDLVGGEELRLSKGPLTEAVLAAAAIPGLLPSVRWGERRLVDGAVVDNTPISHAVELGAERIYVLPTGSVVRGVDKPPQSALDAAIRGITILVDSQLRAQVSRYAGEVELIVLPAPNPDRVQPTDFHHSASLIDGALAAARSSLGGADDLSREAHAKSEPPSTLTFAPVM